MSATKITKTNNTFQFSNENGNVSLYFEHASGKTVYMAVCSYRQTTEEVAEVERWEEPSEFNARIVKKAKEVIAIICDVFENETKCSSQLPFQHEFNFNLLVVDVYGIPVIIRKNNPDDEDLFKTWKKMHDEGLGIQHYDVYPEDDPLLGM